jgi:hypothetical protein
MRAILFALAATATFSALDATPAAAAYGSNPFCMRTLYDDDDCSYRTYEQCTATASGIGLSCFANPALAYSPSDQPAPRVRKRLRNGY